MHQGVDGSDLLRMQGGGVLLGSVTCNVIFAPEELQDYHTRPLFPVGSPDPSCKTLQLQYSTVRVARSQRSQTLLLRKQH